jgi:hypothetical protein
MTRGKVVTLMAKRGADDQDDRSRYGDLEPDICDLVRTAEIAFKMAMEEESGGLTLFSVEHF